MIERKDRALSKDDPDAVATPALVTQRWFFTWAAAACAALTFVGFTPTYWRPIATASPVDVSPAVHIHGALFFAWILLLLLQSWLAASGRVPLHRSLGLLGISVATAMVIFGFIVSLGANVERMESGQAARAYAFGFSNSFALLAFSVLFALAIHERTRPAAHKRLVLFATLMLMNPPVARLYRPIFAPDQPPPLLVFATIDALLVACVWHDWKTLGRVHPVTWGAGSALLAFQLIRFPVARMAWWQAVYDVALRLVE